MTATKMINLPNDFRYMDLNDDDIEQLRKDIQKFFETNFLSDNEQHKLIAYARTDLSKSAMIVYINALSNEIDRLSKEYLELVTVINIFPTFSHNHSGIECAVMYILIHQPVMFVALPSEFQSIENVLFFIKQSTLKEIKSNDFFKYIRDDIKNDRHFKKELNKMKLLNQF